MQFNLVFKVSYIPQSYTPRVTPIVNFAILSQSVRLTKNCTKFSTIAQIILLCFYTSTVIQFQNFRIPGLHTNYTKFSTFQNILFSNCRNPTLLVHQRFEMFQNQYQLVYIITNFYHFLHISSYLQISSFHINWISQKN